MEWKDLIPKICIFSTHSPIERYFSFYNYFSHIVFPHENELQTYIDNMICVDSVTNHLRIHDFKVLSYFCLKSLSSTN